MSNIDYSALINGEESLEPATMSMRSTSSNSDGWTWMVGYDRYSEFTDEHLSKIDESKNIVLDSRQISLTQEHYSQYIPFEMNRYYDGLDFSKAAITINFYAPGLENPISLPVINAKFNDTNVRFAWLVDQNVTQFEGVVKFEVQVTGYVNGVLENGTSITPPYVWRSKTNTQMKVIKSIGGAIDIELPENWEDQVILLVAQTVAEKVTEQNLSETYYNKAEVDEIVANEIGSIEKPDLAPYVKDGGITIDDNYKITLTLVTEGGEEITTVVDLPLEQIIVSGVYDQTTQSIILTLDSGVEIIIPVEDLVSGLASETWVNARIEEVIVNYYTKSEIDTKIGDIGEGTVKAYVDTAVDGVDVTEQLKDYAKTEYVEGRIGNLGVNTDEEGNETPKTVKEYVDAAVAGVDVTEQLKDYAKTSEVEAKIGEIGEAANVVDYVNKAVDSVDVTEQLKDYYTKTEVDEKVDNVSVDLSDYYTKSETDSKVNSSINNALGELLNEEGESVTVKEYVDSHASTGGEQNFYKATYGDAEIEGQTQKNIFTLWTAKEDFNPEQPGETVVSIASQFQITGGSGGGDSNLNKLTIYYDTGKNGTLLNKYAFREEEVNNKKAIINYTFTGVEPNGATIASADATWEYRRGTSGSWKIAKTETIAPTEAGEKLSFNISEFLTDLTSYQFRLKVVDASGAVANASWTVQKIAFKIETNFDDKKTYKIGDIPFYYTPYGASIEKTIHFKWGTQTYEIKTSRSGAELEQVLPISAIAEPARHGSHLLEVYMTATINGELVTSDYVYKDIILFDSTRTVPVIGCAPQNYTIPQYSTLNAEYAVYDPTTNYPKVIIDIDGKVEEKTLEIAVNSLAFKSDIVGTHTITITCTNDKTPIITKKVITVEVTELGYEIAPVPGAVIDFDPVGKMNSDRTAADNGQWKVWNNDNYSLIASADFDWINGGFQTEKDANGKTITGTEHFRIKAGDRAYFDYKFFGGDRTAGTELDPKESGKDFKIIFKTEKVRRAEAKFLTCVSENNGNPIGMEMYVHEGYIHCGGGTLRLPYSEEDVIEYGFKIESTTGKQNPVVMGYEDGVTTSAFVYGGGHSFVQAESDRKYIELGSDDCDLLIYRIKIYEKELKDTDILKNFIADARTGEEMIDRHERNLIFNDDEKLDPITLSKKCPWLRVITISAPHFTDGKKYPVGDTTIEYRYENGKKDGSLSYWKCVNGVHIGQGTSSDLYGTAGRNLDLVLKKHKDVGNTPTIYLDEEETITAKKVALTTKSVPVDYFNIKVNIASSENANNALLQKRFNTYQPYKRPFVRDDGEDTSLIKDTMEFFNCVVFLQETSETDRREFDNGDINFYAIGNIGDSKKTDKTRLTDPDDDYECCLEIADVALPLSDFPVDTIVNAMKYEVKDDNSIEYLFATDENLQAGILLVKDEATGQYIQATGEKVDVENTVYYIDGKAVEDFGGDFTYEWRFIKEYDAKDFKTEENTDEEAEALADAKNNEIATYCADRWWEFYNFVTKTTDEDFKKYFENFFVLDSALYYYLFTTRYTMVDNRAKNSFWHYSKTGGVYEKDIEYRDTNGNLIFSAKAGEPIRKWDLNWGYDMDTALGTDNDGDMVYRYGFEDTDFDSDGVEIFRESDSTFFCRLRDRFATELATKYRDLNNAWSAENLINQFDTWQNEFPEALWREDIYRKYIRTRDIDKKYLDNMANGKKKYQRRQFERNQEKYMASKYRAAAAASDINKFVLRTADTSNDTLAVPVSYDLTIRPYTYMYLVADYGLQGTTRVRVTELDKDYVLKYPGQGRPDFVNIESAHWIESLGDLSPMYLTSISTASAKKLKELLIGSDDFVDYGDNNILTYRNKYLTTLTISEANGLLEKINIENVGYQNALDVSVLPNLQEVYAKGSAITGFVGANGGQLTTVQLPDISTLTIKNLSLLTELTFEGNEKLTTVNIENCNTIDWLAIINNAPNLINFRMIGVNWILDDDATLARIYEMSNYSGLGNSELAGYVELGSVKERDLAKYRERWKDLEIFVEDNNIIPEHLVQFLNEDGTVIDEVYVVDNEIASPTTVIPTKEPTTQYTYEFAYWTLNGKEYLFTTPVTGPMTLVAVYTQKIRSYTVKYWLNNKATSPLYEATGNYGDWISYVGETPVDTSGETATGGIFRLFKGWSASGYVNSDKNIYAEFDEYTYNASELPAKLSELSRVELYAVSKKYPAGAKYRFDDSIMLPFGNDYDYSDIISSSKLHGTESYFDGKSAVPTNYKLFDGTKDFTLAIDFKREGNTQTNAVLFACSDPNGGFELQCDKGNLNLVWGKGGNAKTFTLESLGESSPTREIIVIRHKNKSPQLDVFYSRTRESTIFKQSQKINIQTGELANIDAVLVFGARISSGSYTSYAKGDIYWSKVWEACLGDTECEALAAWPHGEMEMLSMSVAADGDSQQMVPYYYLMKNGSRGEAQLTFLAKYLLDTPMALRNDYINTPGWGGATQVINYLNGRFYQGINELWRPLLKYTDVPYQNYNSGVLAIDGIYNYIFLPSEKELDPRAQAGDVSHTFDIFPNPSDRVCITISQINASNHSPRQYWTRSIQTSSGSNYYRYIGTDGKTAGDWAINPRYLRIMFTI